jgi:hypothetical protein
MLPLIEFYEMLSLNDASLSETEKQMLLKAKLSLRIFERAMQDLSESTRVRPIRICQPAAARKAFGTSSIAA